MDFKINFVLLLIHTDALQQGASQFEQQAGKLKRKFWLQNLKVCSLFAIGTRVQNKEIDIRSSVSINNSRAFIVPLSLKEQWYIHNKKKCFIIDFGHFFFFL